MGIFAMHSRILEEYRQYVKSFLAVSDERVRHFIEEQLLTQNALWPDALIQLNSAYEPAATIEELARQGQLHPMVDAIFQDRGKSLRLYRHQSEAIQRALIHHPYIVTSGTGSGKSLTYLIPIFNHILRQGLDQPCVHAIIVYPMNALVNSQKDAIDRAMQNLPEQHRIQVARYTGQESQAEKDQYKQHPPHVLLTNYVMLEMILTRPDEADFVKPSLAFLVLDEIHTYRGRQGADVAVLVRRLRERSGNPDLLCIGTSATMASGRTRSERRQAVARFATRLFGTAIEPDHVIEETLQRALPSETPSSGDRLRQALEAELPPPTWEAFSQNPLAAWIENTFGITREEDGNLRRCTPISLAEGAQRLAQETGIAVERCQERLQAVLLEGIRMQTPEGNPVFALKLHQFFSQGGTVYATLEAPDTRHLTLEGQYYAPGREERLLYPLAFCRVCGQEYYRCTLDRKSNRLLPELPDAFEALDGQEAEDLEAGYLMPDVDRRLTDTPSYPDHWYDRRGRLKSDYRQFEPRPMFLQPDGQAAEDASPTGIRAWFQKQPLMLCLNCGEAYTRRDQEFRKLAGLSSEGRSSATTVLSLAALLAMQDSEWEATARKLLSFTDNRQDASLQAGHFNDFVQMALLRAALYQALRQYGELSFEIVAARVVEALDLEIPHFAFNPELKPEAARDARRALQEVVEYRLYEDLKRGWRVVHPNLEQCGLLRIAYKGLEHLARNEEAWQSVPVLVSWPPDQRQEIVETLLDHMRRALAIAVECLNWQRQDEVRRRAAQHLNERWAFDENEALYYAGAFVMPGGESQEGDNSLSRQSIFGRWFQSHLKKLGYDLSPTDYDMILQQMVDLLCQYDLLERKRGRPDEPGSAVQLRASALIWRPGDGTPCQDRLRRRRAEGAYQPAELTPNPFFVRLYSSPETVSRLRTLEGREHTAQIPYDRRQERERRFREGKLPGLFCSPTMELGIDIRDLNVVHLRNMPPTPANYAQRSGRAGRGQQPALVLAYCAHGSGHDQYFFKNREQMVAGQVVPPVIDLSNEDLLRAHLHAVWLHFTTVSLHRSILLDVVDVQAPGYPLRPEIKEQIHLSDTKFRHCLEECQRVLERCRAYGGQDDVYDALKLEETLRHAPEAFDRAFDRWRELYALAIQQRNKARAMEDETLYLRGQERDQKKREAERLRLESQRQLELLANHDTAAEESDFYPYRYLASEGFLPGYNFPRLPVRAYIPRKGREGGEFISRSRFLAISEFGPHNVIYHEGAKHRVARAFLPAQDSQKRFLRAKTCESCGYIYIGESAASDVCEHCDTPLTGENSRLMFSLLEMPAMGTLRRERISCEEEERLRAGYILSTHFHFATDREGGRRQQRAKALRNDRELLDLVYGPAATLWQINHQWVRSQQPGFHLDLASGRWMSQGDALTQTTEQIVSDVRLFVRDTANLLLMTPCEIQKGYLLPNLEYALTRGIQEVFQVEERELASERIGRGGQSRILLWEAAEGGLGVLRQLVESPDILARVARAALAILHFDPDTGADLRPEGSAEECSRACYECLLSYYNQHDHSFLNRYHIRDFLMQLAQAHTLAGGGERDYDRHYEWLRSLTDTRSDLERQVLDRLYQTRRRLPDEALKPLSDVSSIPDFFYQPNVCVFCDGSVHDRPQQQAQDETLRAQLKDKGYRVIVIRYDEDLESRLSRYRDVFGDPRGE